MNKKWQLMLGCSAFVGLAAWMLFSAAAFHFKFSGDIRTAQGRVVSMSVRECAWSDGCGKRNSYVVQHELTFRTQVGEIVSTKWDSAEIYSRSELEVGDYVEINYRPTHPTHNYVSMAGGQDRTPHPLGKLLVAIVLLIAGMVGVSAWYFMSTRD